MSATELVEAAGRLLEPYLDDATSAVAAVLDGRRRIVAANRAWNILFTVTRSPVGEPVSDFIDGGPWAELDAGPEHEPVRREMTISPDDTGAVVLAAWFARSEDGYVLLGEIRDQEADDIVARMSEIHQELADITRELSKKNVQLEEAKKRIEELARTDDLTGLLNRRHFGEELERAASFARRHDRPLAVALCDIDHFKAVNDEHGHGVGDEVLRAVAELLQDSCRHEDIAGRYGGEEFILALPSTGREQAMQFAERVRRRVEEESGQRSPVAVTVSFGIAVLDEGERLEDLVQRADRGLYQAKDAGRNRVRAAGNSPPEGA